MEKKTRTGLIVGLILAVAIYAIISLQSSIAPTGSAVYTPSYGAGDESGVLLAPVTIQGYVMYLDDNVTRYLNTSTVGGYTFDGTIERPDNSTGLLEETEDIIPPAITINSAQNTTIGNLTHSFNITLDETGNCTLHLNGTDYADPGPDDNFTWTIVLSQGNYSDISYTCDDPDNNSATTLSYWLNVDTSINITLTKSANVSSAMTGDEINWTITVNNTCFSVLEVNLTDTNGQDFSNGSLGVGEVWTVSYTTTANCSNLNNTVEANASNNYTNYTTTASDSVTVTHCGNDVCDCSETCSSCKDDCGTCPSGGGGGALKGYIITPQPPPEGPEQPPTGGKPEITITGGTALGGSLIVTVTGSDGNPASGFVTVTGPDGSSQKFALEDGVLQFTPDEPGTWTFTYTDADGNEVTKAITLAAAPEEQPKPPAEIEQQVPQPKQPQDNTWIYLLAAAAIITLAAVLLLWKKRIISF